MMKNKYHITLFSVFFTLLAFNLKGNETTNDCQIRIFKIPINCETQVVKVGVYDLNDKLMFGDGFSVVNSLPTIPSDTYPYEIQETTVMICNPGDYKIKIEVYSTSCILNKGFVKACINTSKSNEYSATVLPKVFIIDKDISGGKQEYAVTQKICLLPGASYATVNSDDYLKLKIVPYTYSNLKSGPIQTNTVVFDLTDKDLSTQDNIALDAIGLKTADTAEDNISIFPNPSNGIFNIKSSLTINKLIIYNSLGGKVFDKNGTISSSLDLSNYPKGIYLMEISSQNGKYLKKVVLE